jgi:hypothetical protein
LDFIPITCLIFQVWNILNLVYNTGLPGGSPSYRSLFVPKWLNDYRRVDVGFQKCWIIL